MAHARATIDLPIRPETGSAGNRFGPALVSALIVLVVGFMALTASGLIGSSLGGGLTAADEYHDRVESVHGTTKLP